jgi:hypothetical protein
MAEMPRLGKRYEITEIAQVHLQLSSMAIDTIISNDYTNKGLKVCNDALMYGRLTRPLPPFAVMFCRRRAARTSPAEP